MDLNAIAQFGRFLEKVMAFCSSGNMGHLEKKKGEDVKWIVLLEFQQQACPPTHCCPTRPSCGEF